MKKLSIAEWIAIGIAAALIITCIVLYFTCPRFFYAVSGFTIGALAGFPVGYYICKRYGNANN